MAEGWAAFFTYGLPPLLGAVIGYVTNAIAIKMLFRPLREVRVFGVRLPFTPGIIPRRRAELADSIGRMVSRELLTEPTLRKRLGDPAFIGGLKNQIALLTDRALTAKIHSRRTAGWTDFVRVAEETLRERLRGYLASPSFEALVRRIVDGFAEKFLSRTPAEILAGSGAGKEEAEKFLEGAFAGPFSRRLLQALGTAFAGRLRDGASLETFFPVPPTDSLERLLDAAYPAAAEKLLGAARSGKARREFAYRGRFLLRGILADLNFLQRLIVSAAQYDRTLEENMPKIVDDLLEAAEAAMGSEGFRKAAVAAAAGEIRGLWKRPLREAAEGLGFDPGEAARAAGNFIAGLPRAVDLPGRLAAAFMDFLRSRENVPLGDIVSVEFGIPRDLAAEKSAAFITALVRRIAEDRIAAAPASIADAFLRSMEDRTLGDILVLPRDRKDRLDELLARGVFGIVVKRLPEILKSFEVASLVRDRIDELDVAEVEKLLLAVISRHLAYINVFGALLGALIGGVQVAAGFLR